MRVSSEILRRTHALLRAETAVAAAELLSGVRERAAREGLVELALSSTTARPAVAALAALGPSDDPLVVDALGAALGSPHASVRIAAAQGLHARGARRFDEALVRVLREDESWLARRAALRALADDPGSWRVLAAATDPHWRVRHALIQVLLGRGAGDADERLAGCGAGGRVRGVRDYLHYRWAGEVPAPAAADPPEGPAAVCPFWDWDAAVLARNLERMGEAGRRGAVEMMPPLLAHPDERVRAPAVEALASWGGPRQIAEAVALLDEPRLGTVAPVGRLLSRLDLDRVEEAARHVLGLPTASPSQLAWALDQVGPALPPDEVRSLLLALLGSADGRPAPVRRALARLASRWDHADSEEWLRRFLHDEAGVQLDALRGLAQKPGGGPDVSLRHLLASPSPALRAEAVRVIVERGDDLPSVEALVEDGDVGVRVALARGLARHADGRGEGLLARLRDDLHPHVRAAALTPAAAAELVREPDRETSWHVLARAARLTQIPFWKIEPDPPWRPPGPRRGQPEPMGLVRPHRRAHAAPLPARRLGPDGPLVSAVGVSGHYALPVEGFGRAAEAGVNLFFWEPNYSTLTEFAGRLSVSDRNTLHFIAGTFEADGARVCKDAERALRSLKVERLSLFLLFWAQGWNRVTPDVREALARLKEEGKVAAFGLSTHSRPLAVEAMEAGWNPVMVRHSAAHRGAEERVFPRALETGTSIITFNNTCYGRLLAPHGDSTPPSAADCYRYTLAQPAVTVCLSAPSSLEYLEENLKALRDPALPEERRASLRAHGDRMYQEDAVFRRLVRSR